MFLNNIQGLYRGKDKWKKINLLRETAFEEKPLIIAVVESHLNEEIEIAISDYSLYRTDRYDRVQGGGIHE